MNNFNSLPIFNPTIQMTNSTFIKSEIERFESVHPSIYSIYELLEEIRDQKPLSTQIREHVMIIEGFFSRFDSICFDSIFFSFRFVCQ